MSDETGVSGPGERLAQAEHRLPQIVPRPLLAGIAPEEADQRVSPVRPVGAKSQIREQRLRLSGGYRNRPLVDAELKAAQEDEMQACHGAVPSPIAPGCGRGQGLSR